MKSKQLLLNQFGISVFDYPSNFLVILWKLHGKYLLVWVCVCVCELIKEWVEVLVSLLPVWRWRGRKWWGVWTDVWSTIRNEAWSQYPMGCRARNYPSLNETDPSHEPVERTKKRREERRGWGERERERERNNPEGGSAVARVVEGGPWVKSWKARDTVNPWGLVEHSLDSRSPK